MSSEIYECPICKKVNYHRHIAWSEYAEISGDYCSDCSDKSIVIVNDKTYNVIYQCDKCNRCLYDDNIYENCEGILTDAWFNDGKYCNNCESYLLTNFDNIKHCSNESCRDLTFLKDIHNICHICRDKYIEKCNHFIVDNKKVYKQSTSKCKYCEQYLSKCCVCNDDDCYVCLFSNCGRSQITGNVLGHNSYVCLNCAKHGLRLSTHNCDKCGALCGLYKPCCNNLGQNDLILCCNCCESNKHFESQFCYPCL